MVLVVFFVLFFDQTLIADTQTGEISISEEENKKDDEEDCDSNKRDNQDKNKDKYTPVVVTAYDLSYESCGKKINDKGYGITAKSFNLRGHTWETARVIAVDPKIIPLGSEVEVRFMNDNYKKYNGRYKALDTGGAIKGNKIDLFLGDYNQEKTHQDVWNFGVTEAEIRIIIKEE